MSALNTTPSIQPDDRDLNSREKVSCTYISWRSERCVKVNIAAGWRILKYLFLEQEYYSLLSAPSFVRRLPLSIFHERVFSPWKMFSVQLINYLIVKHTCTCIKSAIETPVTLCRKFLSDSDIWQTLHAIWNFIGYLNRTVVVICSSHSYPWHNFKTDIKKKIHLVTLNKDIFLWSVDTFWRGFFVSVKFSREKFQDVYETIIYSKLYCTS